MHSGPSKTAEAVLAVLLPPACREEVLGDLHEQYSSPTQYAFDALRTVPLVIVSRIRRTADLQVLLIQAFALYLSFVGSAWFKDEALLREPWGFLRLAIPAGTALLGLVVADAYAKPGRRSLPGLATLFGLAFAAVSQSVLWAANPELAVPRWIMFAGCAMSLLLSSAIRMSFPSTADQLQGANEPALWLKQSGGPAGTSQGLILVLKSVVAIIAVAIASAWVADLSPPLRPRLGAAFLLIVLVVAYQVLKQS